MLISVPVDYWLVGAGVCFLAAALMTWEISPGGTDYVDMLFFALIIVPPYVLKQFVLGFPDREELIPVPEAVEINNEPPARKCDTGTVVAALRPMGKIELGGEQFDAASAGGTMIQAGTPIRVCGSRGKLYLVSEVDVEASGQG